MLRAQRGACWPCGADRDSLETPRAATLPAAALPPRSGATSCSLRLLRPRKTSRRVSSSGRVTRRGNKGPASPPASGPGTGAPPRSSSLVSPPWAAAAAWFAVQPRFPPQVASGTYKDTQRRGGAVGRDPDWASALQGLVQFTAACGRRWQPGTPERRQLLLLSLLSHPKEAQLIFCAC